MKLLLILIGLVAAGSATSEEYRDYLLKKNKVPKQVSISDIIMVRGQNGHLQSLRESQRQQPRNDACGVCKEVVGEVNQAIGDPAKLKQLKNMLDLVCDFMGSGKDECKTIVDNLDQILEELRPLLSNPESFCRSLGVCGASDDFNKFSRFMLLYIQRYFRQLNGNSRANDLMCDECQFGVNELKEILKTGQVQDEIKQIAHQICSYLGQEYSQFCDNLADTYLPQLFDEIQKQLTDPKAVCVEIGLCNKQADEEVVEIDGQPLFPASQADISATRLRHVPSSHPPVPTPRLHSFLHLLGRLRTRSGPAAGCVLCRLALAGIVEKLKEQQTMDMISSKLQNLVCEKILPDSYEPGCTDFLRLYLKTVLTMTVDQLVPEKFCTTIHACKPDDLRQVLAIESEQDKQSIVCEGCTTIFEFVHFELRQRDLQMDIAQKAKELCKYLPRNYVHECQNAVDTELPAFLDMVNAELQPSVVCPELKLCPSSGGRRTIQSNEESNLQVLKKVDDVVLLI